MNIRLSCLLLAITAAFFFEHFVFAQDLIKPSSPRNLRSVSLTPSPVPTFFGEITNGQVRRVNSTQVVITYTAPSTSSCTVEVSERPDYSLLVPDVDPAIFSGSNNDLGRFPTLQVGQKRQFVVGSRKFERGSNGRIYSRALASATEHFFRVKCGSSTFETSASTTTLPFGATYIEPPQPSDLTNGTLMLPTIYDTGRGGSFVDPITGTKIYRMTIAGDLSDGILANFNFSSADESTHWSNPNKLLTQDGSYATYAGSSCGAKCDWIKLSGVVAGSVPYDLSVDYVKLKLVGYGDQPNTADRTIEWGLGLAVGGSCASVPLDGETRTLVLPQNSSGQVDADIKIGDTLRSPTADHQILSSEAAGGLCVLIRKVTPVGLINIDHAKWDSARSSKQSTGSGGNYTLSSDLLDSSGYMTTVSNTGGARAVLYKVKMTPTADIKYLGMLPNVDGHQCLVIGYSPTNVHRYYCQPASSDKLFQLDYTGDSTNKTAPYYAEISATLLSSDIPAAIEAFTQAHSAHYHTAFDRSKFNCGFNSIIQGDLLQIVCRRSSQDSYAWLAVWKLGTGIVGAYASWTHPTSRWCVHHSSEEIGQYGGLFFWTTQLLKGGGTGFGPYTTTLNGGVNASQSSITLAGQPSSSNADTFLMNIAAGDTIWIGNEGLTVTGVGSFPTISVTRGAGGTTATAHSNGDTVSMMCAGQPGGAAYQIGTPQVLWDPIADPYADNGGVSNVSYRGHETIRPGLAVNNNSYSLATLTVGVDLPFDYSVTQQPPFAGWIPPGGGVSYQTHPTKHTVIGSAFANRVFADTRPLVGGNLFSAWQNINGCDPTKLLPTSGGCAAQRVPGTNNTYKYTLAFSDRPMGPTLGYRRMPIFANSGRHNMKNISGPGSIISDATSYTFCIALLANECRPGSSPDDIFLSAPGVDYFGCKGGEGFSGGNDLCIAERAGGTTSLTEHNTTPPGVEQFSSRDLTTVNSIASLMRFSSGASTKHLPNGEGIMFTNFRDERYDIFIAKVPPYTGAVDSVDRQTFAAISITTQQVPAGATRLLVKFGYDTNLNCSPNRVEACYAITDSISLSTPFLWESELNTSSGLSVSGGCSGGCVVTIPAVPDKIGFYQLIYRNNLGAVVSTSPVEIF